MIANRTKAAVAAKTRVVEAHWLFERQLAWIAAAEVKVGVVVAIQVALIGGLGAAYFAAPQRSSWAFGSAVACLVCALSALACAAMAVAPRVKGPKGSLVYFGRIAKMSQADYAHALARHSDEALLADISAQIHRNAEIALTKHRWVAKATMLSFMSAIPWLSAIALLSPR